MNTTIRESVEWNILYVKETKDYIKHTINKYILSKNISFKTFEKVLSTYRGKIVHDFEIFGIDLTGWIYLKHGS